MEGNWVNITPEEAYATVKRLLKDKSWSQVSFDPLRHSYFYDRATKQPVIAADDAIQIGRFVLAKNVKYGERESFKYSLNPDIGTDTLQLSDFAGIKDAKTLLEKYVSLGKDQGLKDFANMLLQSKRVKDIGVNFVLRGRHTCSWRCGRNA